MRERLQVDEIIDVHAHNGAWEKTDPGKYDYLGNTIEEFIADLDADGVAFCLISSVTAVLRDMTAGNAETYADAERDPRLLAYTYFDPQRPEESADEALRYRDHPKFVGFKTRPCFHGKRLDDPGYERMIEFAGEWDRPVLVHSWTMADAEAMARVAGRTRADLIMVHACSEHYREAVPLIAPYANVLVEPVTSRHYPGKIRFILDVVGKERLVFGSDYGLLARPRVLAGYEEARLSDAERLAVMSGNARRIFRLPPVPPD